MPILVAPAAVVELFVPKKVLELEEVRRLLHQVCRYFLRHACPLLMPMVVLLTSAENFSERRRGYMSR